MARWNIEETDRLTRYVVVFAVDVRMQYHGQ